MDLVFSHGNSFVAGVYSTLFAALSERGFTVRAIDKLAHDPRYPVTDNWPLLVEQLVDFIRAGASKTGEPALLAGHSLGGILSLMAASGAPGLVRGVILLDAPILGGWRARAIRSLKRSSLFGALSPAAVSRRRRDSWPSEQAALEHFQSKRAFSQWDPKALSDYVAFGTHGEASGAGAQRVLSFERDVETAIYNTLPDNLDALLARHPVECPVAFIGGSDSVERKYAGMALTRKICQGRLSMVRGTHLFPMESPQAAAEAIEAAAKSVSSLPSAKKAPSTQ